MQKVPNKDKMIRTASDKAKGVEQEYFFSGETKWLPQSIKAKSREEAEREWFRTRKKVEVEINKK